MEMLALKRIKLTVIFSALLLSTSDYKIGHVGSCTLYSDSSMSPVKLQPDVLSELQAFVSAAIIFDSFAVSLDLANSDGDDDSLYNTLIKQLPPSK